MSFKITVIIPTYKPQAYLWECLDSICKQSFSKQDYEVILVLNGCNEPYNKQIKDYISIHSDVSWNYIQTDTSGVSNARNIGLDNARGEFITFVDDDDYISISYLEELYITADKQNIALAHPVAFVSKNRILGDYSIEDVYNSIRGKGVVDYLKARRVFQGPCMKLFHKSLIGTHRFDVKFKNGEDSLFMFLISYNFKGIQASSDRAIYYRRVRENSAAYGKKNRRYLIVNSMKLIERYMSIYFSSPLQYSFSFFITRVLGAIKMTIK